MNDQPTSPWPALWALAIGFFMVLVDNAIVSVATPAIGRELGADVNAAMSESLLLPAATLALGLLIVLFYERPSHPGSAVSAGQTDPTP